MQFFVLVKRKVTMFMVIKQRVTGFLQTIHVATFWCQFKVAAHISYRRDPAA
jgi:hypothetical protein